MRVQPPKDYKKYPKSFKNLEALKKYILAHRVIFYDREEMNIVDFWKEFKEDFKKKGKDKFECLDQFMTLFPFEYQIHVMMIFENIV